MKFQFLVHQKCFQKETQLTERVLTRLDTDCTFSATVTYILPSCIPCPFWKGCTLKGNNLFPMGKLFPFIVDPFFRSKGNQFWHSCFPRGVSVPLKISASRKVVWWTAQEKHIYLTVSPSTVEPRYLELAYFELPLISKWKSGPCFNMKLWQQVTK